jgi:hypothetical protein
MVEAALKQKRKEKSDAFHAERDLQQQLRDIEKVAHVWRLLLVSHGSLILIPGNRLPMSDTRKTSPRRDCRHLHRLVPATSDHTKEEVCVTRSPAMAEEDDAMLMKSTTSKTPSHRKKMIRASTPCEGPCI